MTPKVFTLRRERHRDSTMPCFPTTHKILVNRYRNFKMCPRMFSCVTGLSIPVGGSLRVKLVVVRGKKRKR